MLDIRTTVYLECVELEKYTPGCLGSYLHGVKRIPVSFPGMVISIFSQVQWQYLPVINFKIFLYLKLYISVIQTFKIEKSFKFQLKFSIFTILKTI